MAQDQPRIAFGPGTASTLTTLAVEQRCGACERNLGQPLLRHAWQGMRVSLKQWGSRACAAAALLARRDERSACNGATAIVSVSHPHLFERPPYVDSVDGTLHFAIRPSTEVYLVCYTTCVQFTVTWSPPRSPTVAVTFPTTLRISRDPCGPKDACKRSWFLSSQYDCSVGRDLDSVFSRFDGELQWGLGQTIAFIGAAAREPSIEFRRFHGGDPAHDEPVMTNPSWDAHVPRGPKLLGSSTFLPPPQSKAEELRYATIGVHEYAVAWLAVQDSGFVHKYCKGAYLHKFGCNESAFGGDAHSAVAAHFRRYLNRSTEAQICQPHVRRPASLAFNAQAYLLQVYAGAKGQRAMRKDDHYIELEISGSGGKPAPINATDVEVLIPRAFVERLRNSLRWLEANHVALNITVVCVSVLTMQKFVTDPVADEELAASARRLRAAGVVLLANGGNCRHWHKNCTGLPWPAVASGFTPVGAASMYNAKFGTLGANKFTSQDVSDCSRQIPAVCGASVTSSALPFFAASILLIREAIEATGFAWESEGATFHDAVLNIVHKSGRTLKRNSKATECSNRRCIDVAAAIDYIRGNASNRSISLSSRRGARRIVRGKRGMLSGMQHVRGRWR